MVNHLVAGNIVKELVLKKGHVAYIALHEKKIIQMLIVLGSVIERT